MKISITLPNYNHAAYLKSNIDSYLKQSYPNWELLILDDGSTDESWSVIEYFCRSDARIRAERFTSNCGANVAMKRLLSACSGELIHPSSADDYILDRRFFERSVENLAKYPKAAGVFGPSRVIDAQSGEQLWIMGRYAGSAGFISAEQALEDFFFGRLFIPGISALWKRSLVEAFGGYDESLGPQSDYFLNHALPMLHGVVYIPEVVAAARHSRGSFSHSANDERFFMRHALVEKKLKAVLNGKNIPAQWLQEWRRNMINGRLSLDRHLKLIELWSKAFSDIQEWERDGLRSEFTECEAYLRDRCDRLSRELQVSTNAATKIFDDIAGRIPNHHNSIAAQSSQNAPYQRLAISLIRKTRAAMRRLSRLMRG